MSANVSTMLVAIPADAFLKTIPMKWGTIQAMNQQAVHELAQKHAVLEERMNTKQAEYKTDIATLAGKIDAAMESTSSKIETAMEGIKAEMARRDKQMLLAIFGMIALAVTLLTFLDK